MVRKLILLTVLLSWPAATGLGDFSEQFEQAEQLREQGRLGQAEAVFRQIIAEAGVSDDGLRAYEKLILMQIGEKRLTSAREAYDDLTASFSGYEGLVDVFQSELGCAFREARDYSTALKIYQYLLVHGEGRNLELSYRSSLFKCYVGLGDDPNAEAQLQQVLTGFAEDEGLANTIWDMAYECRSMKKWARSRTLFEYFMGRWGGHKKALLAQRGIAKASIKLGDVERADAAITKLIELFGTSKGIVHQVKELANDWAESDRYDKAIPIFAQVVSRWPADANAMLAQKQIAAAHLGLGDFEKADAAVDKLVSDFAGWADVAEAVYEIAKKNSELGRHDKAAEQFRVVLARWRGHEDAIWCQMELVFGKIRQWDLDGAEGELGVLLSEFADDRRLSEAVHEIVEEYRNTGAHEEGRELFNYLLTEWAGGEETMLELQVGIALQSIKLGELDKAEAAVERLIADYNDNPKIAKALFQIAEEHFYKRHYWKTIELLELIHSDYPDSKFPARSEVAFVLATCYKQVEESDKAIANYERTLKEYPKSRYAAHCPYRLGWIYMLRKGDYDKAIYWYRQQRKLYPDASYSSLALFDMGSTYVHKLKDYAKGAEVCQEYVNEYPDGWRIWGSLSNLARCHEHLGNTQEAIEVLRQAHEKAKTEGLRKSALERIQVLEKGGTQ
ncbi:MAG: tetratricopeptide repeat protein [Planctomycetota bacterium]|jgi:tetratricopeptide (TPR) repeat protein